MDAHNFIITHFCQTQIDQVCGTQFTLSIKPTNLVFVIDLFFFSCGVFNKDDSQLVVFNTMENCTDNKINFHNNYCFQLNLNYWNLELVNNICV